jgi:hypothetical protein
MGFAPLADGLKKRRRRKVEAMNSWGVMALGRF